MQGVDAKYDDAVGRVKDVEADLAEYLQQIRRQLGAGKDLCYVTVNKDVNLLEIPEVTHFRRLVVLQSVNIAYSRNEHTVNLSDGLRWPDSHRLVVQSLFWHKQLGKLQFCCTVLHPLLVQSHNAATRSSCESCFIGLYQCVCTCLALPPINDAACCTVYHSACRSCRPLFTPMYPCILLYCETLPCAPVCNPLTPTHWRHAEPAEKGPPAL